MPNKPTAEAEADEQMEKDGEAINQAFLASLRRIKAHKAETAGT